MPKPKPHPSRKLLKQLKAAGWTKKHDGLFWQSPHNGYFFAPAGAVAEEKLRIGILISEEN